MMIIIYIFDMYIYHTLPLMHQIVEYDFNSCIIACHICMFDRCMFAWNRYSDIQIYNHIHRISMIKYICDTGRYGDLRQSVWSTQ